MADLGPEASPAATPSPGERACIRIPNRDLARARLRWIQSLALLGRAFAKESRLLPAAVLALGTLFEERRHVWCQWVQSLPLRAADENLLTSLTLQTRGSCVAMT